MKIAIDDISMAMEDHTGAVEHFLNRQTGDLLRVPIVPDDADEHEDALAALEKSPADWVQIPSLPSPDAFQIMEDFVAGLPEGDPRKTLKLVLGFKKPFANFKRALLDMLEIREQWFAYHGERMEDIVRRWLEFEGIVAE
jgi:hypothetical protein